MERERGGRPRYPGVLTPAEQRVLEELRNGGSNAEIAARLGLSRETVKTHIASMLSKLDLPDRYALAAWRPEPPRRGARGWLGLLVRPAIGLGAATGVGAVIVILAVVIGASRDDTESIDIPLAETESEVLSCSSGVAVTSPGANAELVADCDSLLGLRDTLRGTGELNWTAGKPMSEWMGVTVSGTPQRVTSLNLADLGLDGELSGLLGNLMALTTLDLSGNALTGMIPSKLGLLENLTTVAISGTSFTGCAPPVMRTVATNDVTTTGMDDCGEAPLISTDILSPRPSVIPSGTHSFFWPTPTGHHNHLPPITFDLPEGLSIPGEHMTIVQSTFSGPRPPGAGRLGLTLEDPVKGYRFWIDLEYGGVSNRYFYGKMSAAEQEELDALIDLVAESTWFKPQ